MSPQLGNGERSADGSGTTPARRGPLRLIARTFAKAWDDNIFSEAAEAAFWQTLSLPPLLLGLLGSLGFAGDWFGPEIVRAVQQAILDFCRTVFTGDVVDRIMAPTVENMLTNGRGEIVSVGFLISLWAGSSAMASFVDAITVVYNQYGVRHPVWQRIFALLLYLAGLVLIIVGLPVLALGPDLLPQLFPMSWRGAIANTITWLYYPAVGAQLVIALTTLYKVALPRKLPWHRGLPGAVLAMVFFLLGSSGLRWYISAVTSTGFTYGALATPIALLLFAYVIGLAIIIGAHFNNAIQELWPARMSRRERRRWRRLEMERTAERLRAEQSASAEKSKSAAKQTPQEATSPADTEDTVRLRRDGVTSTSDARDTMEPRRKDV